MSDDTSIPTPVRCAYDIRHQTPEHHAACLSYVRHRYKITGPITVTFPGSCGKAQPLPEWDEVRGNSLPVCACGRDRAVFPPLAVSPVPVGRLPASLPESIFVDQEGLLLIRSSQGAGHACYSVAIEDGQLIVESDPIAGIGDLLVGVLALPTNRRSGRPRCPNSLLHCPMAPRHCRSTPRARAELALSSPW